MDNILLQQLAKRLNLTEFKPDEEPYILTPEEEKQIIDHEIRSGKEYYKWRHAGTFSEFEVETMIANMNWEELIDKEEVLKRANSNKQHELWHKAQREKDKQDEADKIKQLQLSWTAKRIYQLMVWTSEKEFGKKLIVNNDNKPFITALCFFLSNDKRFNEVLKYSFKKGLLIRGAAGIGKTHIVQCVAKNDLKPISAHSMIEITESIIAEGEYHINMDNHRLVYLDDVGTEETTVLHFGSRISFFKNFIEKIYLKRSAFNELIISTNLNFRQIEEKYGFRVASRMREMFNIIDVTGKDMRNDANKDLD